MGMQLKPEERSALCSLEEVYQYQEDGGDLTLEGEEDVLAIIRDYPVLALESAISAAEGYGILPLEFLLTHRASLSTIQSLCKIAPDAPQQKNFWWSFPLHEACEYPSTFPGVIPYLVELYPQAASWKNMHEKRPIDCLLGRQSSLDDVQSLLRVHQPTTVSDQDNLLQVAFEGPNDKEILEFIVDQCPKVKSFRADKLQVLCPNRAQALTRLLPQLKIFRFRSKSVELIGWQHLMHSLGSCESIQRLHLDIERTACRGDIRPAMSTALATIPNLLDLTLLGRRRAYGSQAVDNVSERNETMGRITEAIATLLRRNSLECIRIENVSLQHETIFDVLKHDNTSLRRMYMVGCVDSNDKRKDLVDVLLQNTSLQDIPIRSYGGDSTTYEKIDYWTKLNRFGRRIARNPRTSLKKFVSMLHDANVRSGVSSRDQDHLAQITRAQLLYGLLRECPSIWCG